MGSTGQLSAVAQRRLQSELKEWHNSPPEGCSLESCEPINQWVIIMQGPDGQDSLYQDLVFRVKIRMGERYPLESPEVTFIPKVPRHPHCYSNGHICLDMLYDSADGGWSPALTISKVCLALRSMLASNREDCGPPGDEEYCKRVGNRSPKLTRWVFDDDKV